MRHPFTVVGSGVEADVVACSVAVLFLVVAGCSGQQEPVSSPGEIPMQQVAVEGIRIHYVEKGEGNPLVLVHGIPTSSYLWRGMIDELSAHGRVIALDLPGFGLSDPPPDGDYTISRYARILASFLEALAVERATLVCHDLGGPIVLTYALRHPEKYERLVILDTFLHRDIPPLPLSMRIARIRPLGELFLWLGGEAIARAALEEGVFDKSTISQELVRRYYMPAGDPGKLNRSMLGTLRMDYQDDVAFIEQNLSSIEKPTLILWAEHDAYLPLRLGQRIHEDIRGSRMERIPDCGHFIPEDQPERATKAIVDFLSST